MKTRQKKRKTMLSKNTQQSFKKFQSPGLNETFQFTEKIILSMPTTTSWNICTGMWDMQFLICLFVYHFVGESVYNGYGRNFENPNWGIVGHNFALSSTNETYVNSPRNISWILNAGSITGKFSSVIFKTFCRRIQI